MLLKLLFALALGAPSDLEVTVPAPAAIPRCEVDYLIEHVPQPARFYLSEDGRRGWLDNGLVRRGFVLGEGTATVSLEELQGGSSLLRAVRPEARVTVDGRSLPVGGRLGQPNHAFLRPEWLEAMSADPQALALVGHEVGPVSERLPWKRVRHHAPGVAWPPPGVHLTLRFRPSEALRAAGVPDLEVRVHHELYDGVPVLSKWLEVENLGAQAITLDSFSSEILAVVEEESRVEAREGVTYPLPSSLLVMTDMAFGGMTAENVSRHAVHWRADPQYSSQVNYKRITPCLLDVSPDLGPAQVIEPGAAFESLRAFELVHDSSERERRGLAQRRMLRTIAPWVTENPLMHHLRVSGPDQVRRAVEQAAEVGFEMVILSFGSGFHIESEDPAYIAGWKELADHAHEHGVELGGYSLLASRSISPEDDVVLPEGQRPTFGNSPCLESPWGRRYFEKLYAFFEATGFDLLEHDGNYPGDPCHSVHHPGHSGALDSRWNQWRRITDFYKWCRGRGIYLNVPDYYYLSGSTKSGMGYREVNWSLPRAEQVIHTRQNIFDGTWTKTPSMGWMFVPLTEYHGGGAAATIEPLDEHRDHYRRMLESNLALGVQACYRGPRLFDTERTRDLLAERVAWFKAHREVLEADLVHGRRADGRDLDWMLHVNPFPSGPEAARGMLVAFNPLTEEVRRTLDVPLYYTGLDGSVRASVNGGPEVELELDRRWEVRLELSVPPGGMGWVAFH